MQPERPEAPHPALRILRHIEKHYQRLHALLEAGDVPAHLPAESPPPGLQDLTPTERAIWQRIADPADEKYAKIYPDLGMSKRNFDKHVGRLFRKLGVRKRSGAARLWGLYGRGRASGAEGAG